MSFSNSGLSNLPIFLDSAWLMTTQIGMTQQVMHQDVILLDYLITMPGDSIIALKFKSVTSHNPVVSLPHRMERKRRREVYWSENPKAKCCYFHKRWFWTVAKFCIWMSGMHSSWNVVRLLFSGSVPFNSTTVPTNPYTNNKACCCKTFPQDRVRY